MNRDPDPSTRKVMFVVNNAAFFVSHRLPIALEAQRQGYVVELCTGQAGSVTLEAQALEELAARGLTHRKLVFRSDSMNPFVELLGLIQLTRWMRLARPTVVHCASPKGVLYGGIAARIAGVSSLVLAVSGMGYAFTDSNNSRSRQLLRRTYARLVRLAYGHRNRRVIVQNQDDRRSVIAAGLARPAEVELIPGSGVPLERYIHLSIEAKEDIVILPARMLMDKGVIEFAEAARVLRAQGCRWQFMLVGTADYHNPSMVSPKRILEWMKSDFLTWAGHVDDMTPIYARASIVCLPSYREGMPKSLLEAAAAGCAVVTTDVVGCKEAILPGITGDLVPPRDAQALANVLAALIADAPRRKRYATNGRQWAIEQFGLPSVIQRTLQIYRELDDNA